METLRIDPDAVDLVALIDRGTKLHGHLGPFLVAGVRMGLLALSLLGSTGYFGITAVSETGYETPLSCLTDGVQIGSGCTTGKGNLQVVESGRPRVRFTTAAGKSVVIELRPEVVEEFKSGELREEGARTQHRPIEELFTWTITR